MQKSKILLVTIDALRADRLSCLGYHKRTTPNLDLLANKGVLFTQAFSHHSFTPGSFSSIFTSTYPLMHRSPLIISSHVSFLSEALQKSGYTTAAFHSNPDLSKSTTFKRGFDTFEDFLIGEKRKIKKKSVKERVIKQLSKNPVIEKTLAYLYIWKQTAPWKQTTRPYGEAHQINRKAFSWLEENFSQNFFLWLHYMDVHPPYTSHDSRKNLKKEIRFDKKMRLKNKHGKRIKKEEVKFLSKLYDEEIKYVDSMFGYLMDKLEKLGILEKTMIVVTSDHGQEFLEHKGIFHGHKLYDELLHVPLVIYFPQMIEKRKAVNNLTPLISIAPTIADVAGVKESFQSALGKSLLSQIKGEEETKKAVISETALWDEKYNYQIEKRKTSYRTKYWKFIFNQNKEENELYNLQTDPKEKENLVGEKGEIAMELEKKVKEYTKLENKIRRLIGEKELQKRVGRVGHKISEREI